ncbi:TPA: hypothetical protein ACTYSP_004269 [Citrobacter freundii]
MRKNKIVFIAFCFSQSVLANNKLEQHPRFIRDVMYDIELKIDSLQKGESLGVFVGMVNGETFSPVNASCHISDINVKPERSFSMSYIPPEVLSKGYSGYFISLGPGWPDSTLTMKAACKMKNKLSALSINLVVNNSQPKFVTVNDKIISLDTNGEGKKHYISYVFNN